MRTTHTASILGDPHFLSFSGGVFDIKGQVGIIYLIWLDQYVQWNSRFVARRSNPARGTQLGECGLVFANATLHLNPAHHRTNLKAAGVQLNVAEGVPTVVPTLGRIVLVVYRKSVTLQLPCFWAHFMRAVKTSNTVVQHRQRIVRTFFHYNVLVAKRVSPGCQPHGLLGQTYSSHTAAAPQGINGEGVIEGTLDDYIVPTLFGVTRPPSPTHTLF
eukprot:NODE_2081_length_992_cov_30.729586_g1681_i1.p1 GENE.NODE_2081_length_992_cov_30.729586_g1681_i1~~NODE_2081_length_992_cov_30.729586_g1681_i1.p1  ORF type:complete len:216 (-),score=31.41 NODE_2081_length_992_cov_30.729586_g1681_i1:97-744(-)